jgi:predicted O-linked N-acetylglucosamine transferase (SPINDLY family)
MNHGNIYVDKKWKTKKLWARKIAFEVNSNPSEHLRQTANNNGIDTQRLMMLDYQASKY